LNFVINYLQSINALSFKLVQYEVMSGDDLVAAKEDKGSNVDLSIVDEMWVDMSNNKYVEECKQNKFEIDDPKTEVGIANMFRDNNGDVKYLMFADCDVADWREIAYDLPGWRIAKTDKGHHAYTKQHVATMEDFCKLLTSVKCVDSKWLLLSDRLRGFAVLRVTANCKQTVPYFIK
jgi:hypothetical protein